MSDIQEIKEDIKEVKEVMKGVADKVTSLHLLVVEDYAKKNDLKQLKSDIYTTVGVIGVVLTAVFGIIQVVK